MWFKKKKKVSGHKSFSGKGIFPHKWAFTLLIPIRNIFLSPKTLLKRLEIKKSDTVLEVGPGPGYFSPFIAKATSQGRLILADIQKQMLEKAKKRLDRLGLKNVTYYHCQGDDFALEDQSIDLIFLVSVLGEIEHQKAYLKEFYRLLRSKGIVSVTETWGDPDHMKLESVQALFVSCGFKVQKAFRAMTNYTIHFSKP